jgi:flavodoxin II
MAKILIVFGSDTGNTEEVAEKVRGHLSDDSNIVEIVDVKDVEIAQIDSANLCIFGIPTWDFGGIQGDWEDFEASLSACDFENKAVALFGLGDQFGYGDYFIDAVGWLHEIILPLGADIKGYWPVDGYVFEESRALSTDRRYFFGLAIDEDQQFELSDKRIKQWVIQLRQELPWLSQ